MRELKLSTGGILKVIIPSFIFGRESKHSERFMLITSSKKFTLEQVYTQNLVMSKESTFLMWNYGFIVRLI